MGFHAVATSSRRTWSAAEDRVLLVLLTDKRASGSTAAGIADIAGTHESTVIRLAQKLGYSGFTELRADLRRDEDNQRARHRSGGADDGADETVAAFGASEAQMLGRIGDFVPDDALLEAARAIHASTDVYLFAKNDDRPLRDLLARRLRRMGKTVHPLDSAAKDLSERIVNFDEKSALVAFALRASSRYLPALVAETQRRGGPTVLITDVSGSPFQPPPQHVLAVPRAADEEFGTDIVPMAICYALQHAVFRLDPEGYVAIRTRIDDVTRLLGGRFEPSAVE